MKYKSKYRMIRMCAGLMCIILIFAFTGCGKSQLEVKTVVESSEVLTEDQPVTQDKIKNKTEDNNESASAGDSEGDSESVSEDLSQNSASTICVYVCGAVVQEGVYELPNGSRTTDALEAAGGYAENAVHGYLNLAEPLVDGERIYFPYEDEEETLDMALGAESDYKTDFKSESKSELVSGVEPEAGPKSGDSSESGSGLVNINTAGADELKTLSGIGDSRAADIIAYREANGSFSSIEDIMNVSGIGESIFNKIKPYITVE